MQTWDAIRSRRNVRRYDPETLVQGELDRDRRPPRAVVRRQAPPRNAGGTVTG